MLTLLYNARPPPSIYVVTTAFSGCRPRFFLSLHPLLRPTMLVSLSLHFITVALFASSSISYHVPTTLIGREIAQPNTRVQHLEGPMYNYNLQRRNLRRRAHAPESAHREISISPQFGSSSSADSSNSTSSSLPQSSQNIPPWILTSEAIITAVFRAFTAILMLFNVNFTWRIHGTHHPLRILELHLMTIPAFHAREEIRPRGRRRWHT